MQLRTEMINITENSGSIEFEIIAKPKASKNAIGDVHDGALKISVTAPPDKGKANKAIIKLLSKELKIPQSSISIISGETSRRKKVRIEGVTSDDIRKIAGEGG